MSDHLQLTIADLETKRGILAGRIAKIDDTIETLQMFVGKCPKGRRPTTQKDIPENIPNNIPALDVPTGRRGPHKGRRRAPKPGRFKGVKRGKDYADGRPRFLANVHHEKKFKHLGTFDVEELAAAAVEEFGGNTAEAQRLRAIAEETKADFAEQAENNPDRPETRRIGDELIIWQCNRCGHDHQQSKRPGHCESCQAVGMTKIQPRRRATEDTEGTER